LPSFCLHPSWSLAPLVRRQPKQPAGAGVVAGAEAN